MDTNHERKPLVIYHKNCHDGFGAAWCFWDVSHTAYEFVAANYNDPVPDVMDRVVYMVDFSYPRELVKFICSRATQVYLIDHHKTAIEDLAGLEQEEKNFVAYTDLKRSGAMLAWDFLYNVHFAYTGNGLAEAIVHESVPGDSDYIDPPILLEHIQDRDLWKFKLDGTKTIHLGLASRNVSFEEWDKLVHGRVQSLLNLQQEGLAIERKYNKDIQSIIAASLRFMDIFSYYRVPVVNCPGSFASDIGNSLYSRSYEELEGQLPAFSATYYDTKEYRIFSLRSKDSFDVSAIAQRYGGGGHRNAAGFKVSRDHFLAQV